MIILNNVFILKDLKKCTCISVYNEQMKQQDQERSKSPLKNIYVFLSSRTIELGFYSHTSPCLDCRQE